MYAIKTDYSKSPNRLRVYHEMHVKTRKTLCGFDMSVVSGWMTTSDPWFTVNRRLCINCIQKKKEMRMKKSKWRLWRWMKKILCP